MHSIHVTERSNAPNWRDSIGPLVRRWSPPLGRRSRRYGTMVAVSGESPPPSGTVTFLFTDIEGSTRAWEQDGEWMELALADHDRLVRETTSHHGGYVFATGGDGFAVAFVDPADAAHAAVEIQRQLDLPVRMGLHTGVAHERDGDYFGPVVNRAARVMSLASGGEVLVSQTAAGLLVDAPGLALVSLGEHRLADMDRPEHLHQLVAEGSPAAAPRARLAATRPNNLPGERNRFVGRAEMVASVAEAVTEHRLVTLTGVGGVGKTRLALQVGAAVLPRFDHGAWFCEFAPIDDTEGLAGVIGSAVGVRQRQGLSMLESILATLKHRHVLLLLDNCEHVIDQAVQIVEPLLNSSPNVHVLATSREGLGIDGERIVAVSSLSIPPQGPYGEIAAATSVQLFVDRATSLVSGFELTEENAAAIAEICQRLDGIPLALELAAGRVSVMSPRQIAEGLDDRFSLLTGGRARSRSRHQTLRSTIDWSHDLMDEQERVAFRRLAVFGGTFDLEGAAAVVEGEGSDPAGVIDVVAGLVDKSLLATEAADGRTRYRFLESIRQYAEERLESAGELDAIHERAIHHLSHWAIATSPDILGPDEEKWIARLRLEAPTIRRLVDWALEHDRPQLAVDLVAPFHRGINTYGEVLRQTAAKIWRRAPALTVDGAMEAYALAAEDALMREEVELVGQIGAAINAIAAERRLDPPSSAFNIWAQVEGSEGRMSLSYELAERCLELARSAGDQGLVVHGYASVVVWGHAASCIDSDEARSLADRAYEVAVDIGSPALLSVAEFVVGFSRFEDNPASSLSHFEAAIDLAPVRSNTYDAAVAFAARAAIATDDFEQAIDYLRRVIHRWVENGQAYHLDFTLAVATSIAHARGDRDRAAKLYEATTAVPALDHLWPEWRPPLAEVYGRPEAGDERSRESPIPRDQAIALVVEIIDAGLA